MRVLAKDLAGAAQKGEETELRGWVYRIRDMGKITFVILRDRSALAQLVFDDKPVDSGGNPLTLESVIAAWGVPSLNEKAPGGAELRVSRMECLSRAAADLPFQVNGDVSRMGVETLLDNRALSLRNPKIRGIFKIQSVIIEAFAEYLRDRDFTEIKTSKLVGSGTEGGTSLFPVEYFDRRVYLAQSPQLYKQIMVASGLERVFEIGPAFRAEKHDTPRHLNEYVSLDVEMGFIESEKDLIELEKGLLAHIFEAVAQKSAAELERWNASVPAPDSVFKAPTVSYEEALRIAGAGGAARFFDINPEAERLLSEWALRERGIDLLFVNQFPRRHRPFYTYPLDLGTGAGADSGRSAKADSGKSAKADSTMSFDTLFRGLEITSGSRRQHDYNALLEALPKFGLKAEDMAGYLSVFKYGCPPHGGFAIGCERLTQKILGLANVKEASLFPRDRRRVEP